MTTPSVSLRQGDAASVLAMMPERSMCWQITNKADPAVARLADDHYSRQKRGARQFSPPGRVLVLYIPGENWPFRAAAGWVWWHPHENSPMPRMDGFQGWWQCSFFRNESHHLSSALIREAIQIVDREWGHPLHGYDTYVEPAKIKLIKVHGVSIPGWCYVKAGWKLSNHWTKDGKKVRLYLEATDGNAVIGNVTPDAALGAVVQGSFGL